ncbi:hypothetical protein DXG01_003394, partial [Tephrocybe rancida]
VVEHAPHSHRCEYWVDDHGPNGKDDQQIYTKSYSFGANATKTGLEFQDTANFKKNMLVPFGKHVAICYPTDTRTARVVHSKEHVVLPEGKDVHVEEAISKVLDAPWRFSSHGVILKSGTADEGGGDSDLDSSSGSGSDASSSDEDDKISNSFTRSREKRKACQTTTPPPRFTSTSPALMTPTVHSKTVQQCAAPKSTANRSPIALPVAPVLVPAPRGRITMSPRWITSSPVRRRGQGDEEEEEGGWAYLESERLERIEVRAPRACAARKNPDGTEVEHSVKKARKAAEEPMKDNDTASAKAKAKRGGGRE